MNDLKQILIVWNLFLTKRCWFETIKNNDFDYLIKRFETNLKRQNQSNTFLDVLKKISILINNSIHLHSLISIFNSWLFLANDNIMNSIYITYLTSLIVDRIRFFTSNRICQQSNALFQQFHQFDKSLSIVNSKSSI